ncbi:DUF4287 domain-containing protein [Myxococcus sp. CA040A]|uniref:DUF4287 domain-containing protein n=1 Tax=Myxococcus sp. CA040A TaxID=2741738 RepID=UPI00352DDE71
MHVIQSVSRLHQGEDGHGLEDFARLVAKQGLTRHGEIVAWLKDVEPGPTPPQRVSNTLPT